MHLFIVYFFGGVWVQTVDLVYIMHCLCQLS